MTGVKVWSCVWCSDVITRVTGTDEFEKHGAQPAWLHQGCNLQGHIDVSVCSWSPLAGFRCHLS